MSATRFGRLQKATALIPLALLSAAATASISGVGGAQASADPSKPTLPDGTNVPAVAIQDPASVSLPPVAAPGATSESTTQIVSTASAASIPAAALAAYQRAETVINRADRTCRLPWQLIAAIGRVESNHGRANGNTLDTEGIAQPGIFGLPLNGQPGTSVITDTDGGRFDGDTAYDRAVGPMQFIPSTWSAVGVDADGDGQRNPQDVNDAALAAAVYLCSGEDDLSTTNGQSAAVYRYNHSASYVATVLAVMRAYQSGDFTSAPNYTVAASYFVPDLTVAAPLEQKGKKAKKKPKGKGPITSAAGSPQAPATSGSSGSGTGPVPGSGGGTGGDNTGPLPGGGGGGGGTVITTPPIDVPDTGVKPVDDLLTEAEARAQCLTDFGFQTMDQFLAALANPLNAGKIPTLADLNACITGYTT